jgi:large subunit ribosomal protein L24
MATTQKMHIKKGDMVIVTSGREKGKSGKVLRINGEKNTVTIEKLNLIKRHTRPSQQAPQGGIIEREAALHASNVNLLCVKCNAPVRTRRKLLDDTKKVRTCHKCGEVFDN